MGENELIALQEAMLAALSADLDLAGLARGEAEAARLRERADAERAQQGLRHELAALKTALTGADEQRIQAAAQAARYAGEITRLTQRLAALSAVADLLPAVRNHLYRNDPSPEAQRLMCQLEEVYLGVRCEREAHRRALPHPDLGRGADLGALRSG